MRLPRLIFLGTVLMLGFQAACIGRQPAQQGTWSRQDHFKTKVTDMSGYSPENPDRG